MISQMQCLAGLRRLEDDKLAKQKNTQDECNYSTTTASPNILCVFFF